MDTDRADDFLRGDGERGDGDDGGRDGVDFIAVVAVEDLLLVAKYQTPQCRGFATLPALSREFDAVFRRQKFGKRLKDHAVASRS